MINNHNNSIDGIRRTRRFEPRRHKVPRKKVEKRDEPHKVVISSPPLREQKSPLKTLTLRLLIPALLGIVVAFLLLNLFDSAKVTVQAHRELVNVDTELTAQRDAGSTELPFAVMAVSGTEQVEVTPDSTQEVRTKASGTITVYNDYSTAPQRLLPETRFTSIGGKLFYLGKEELVIPGKTDNRPGEVTTTVYAAEAGESYNIDATDFTIPGFQELGLDEKYTNIYALSEEEFTGGYVGVEPAISQEREETQEQILRSQLTESLKEKLVNEKTAGMDLIQNTASLVLEQPKFEVNEETGTGTLSLSGTMYTLLVKEEDLATYLSQQELQLAPEAEVGLKESTLLSTYTGEKNIDYENQEEVPVSIEGKALFTWKVDDEAILESLRGVSKKDIPSIIQGIQSVGSLNVRTHPRWAKTLPEKIEHISVRVVE